MTRKEILDNAMKCVNGDRDEQYGRPEDSFATIADFWTTYLKATGAKDVVISSADVAAMMALMKIARISTGAQKVDSWIDLAGYAACGGEVDSLPKNLFMSMSSDMITHVPHHGDLT